MTWVTDTVIRNKEFTQDSLLVLGEDCPVFLLQKIPTVGWELCRCSSCDFRGFVGRTIPVSLEVDDFVVKKARCPVDFYGRKEVFIAQNKHEVKKTSYRSDNNYLRDTYQPVEGSPRMRIVSEFLRCELEDLLLSFIPLVPEIFLPAPAPEIHINAQCNFDDACSMIFLDGILPRVFCFAFCTFDLKQSLTQSSKKA